MQIRNSTIIEMFEVFSDLLEINNDNPFRIRAYRNAARTIRALSPEIYSMDDIATEMAHYPGIGKDLASKINKIVQTGHFVPLDSLSKRISVNLVNLMHIAGLGAKRVAFIHKKLGITSVDELLDAAMNHKICSLPGFGEKIEAAIIKGIYQIKNTQGNFLLSTGMEIALHCKNYMLTDNNVHNCTIAGSIRRYKEVIHDIDLLVSGCNPSEIMNHFLTYPDFKEIITKGEKKSTGITSTNLHIDIRLVDDLSYGSALHYFTGSQAHNIAIRTRGMRNNLKINEYGIYRDKSKVGGRNEKDVFDFVNLPFIEPELRENSGEIEAAEAGTLPELITLSDLRGDLHTHTSITDGHATMEEMAEAAIMMGYSYMAVTDHSKRIFMAHGLNEQMLLSRIDEMNELNGKYQNFTILKGIEVDILDNGQLDLDNGILQYLDLTVCSVHSKMNLSKDMQTNRILKAMENPYFSILAHPTGRILNKRMPFEIDMEKIMYAAKERRICLEINAFPERMDLDSRYCRMAKEIGVKMVISTDAHSTLDLRYMHFGIGTARRGWIEKKDVINTLDTDELLQFLRR
jgi:DNA polymerase (family 10)